MPSSPINPSSRPASPTKIKSPKRRPGAAWKSVLHFTMCVAGVWAAFVRFGQAQEDVMQLRLAVMPGESKPTPVRFSGTCFLILVMALVNAAVALVVVLIQSTRSKQKVNLFAGVAYREWYSIALAYMLSQTCGHFALQFIIYPLQVLVKSCKMVPVLIGSMLITRTRYGWDKILIVLLLTTGIGAFMYFGPEKHEKLGGRPPVYGIPAAWIGVCLAGLSLICDGIYGPKQDKIIATHNPSPYHLMFNMNLFLAQWSLVGVLVLRELPGVFAFVEQHPEMLYEIGLFATCMTVGQLFLFQLQAFYGSLVVCMVTTSRKFFSVLYSVIRFGHQLAFMQWAAVALVFLALFGEIILKWREPPGKAKGKSKH